MTVSTVIPCYNAAEFLEDGVQSVWAQKYSPVEIVCVDDGSTDNTLDVLHKLKEVSPVPFEVVTGPNEGPSHARNKGTRIAKGDYIQYLDTDDLLLEGKLGHQASLVKAQAAPVDLVVGSYIRAPYGSTGEKGNMVELHHDVWGGLLSAQLGITSANLWRRTSVIEAGGWDEDLQTSEDPDLVFRLLLGGGNLVRDTRALTRVRRRPDSQWNENPVSSTVGWLRLRNRIVSHLRTERLMTPEREKIISNEAFQRVSRLFDQGHVGFAAHMFVKLVNPKYLFDSGKSGKIGWVYRLMYQSLRFEDARRLHILVHSFAKCLRADRV